MMTMYPGLEKRFQDEHRADIVRQAERWRLWRLASARQGQRTSRSPAPAPRTQGANAPRPRLLQVAQALWELL